MGRRWILMLLGGLAWVFVAQGAYARNLDQVIPELFGNQGSEFPLVSVSGLSFSGASKVQTGVLGQLNTIGDSLGSFRSQIPVASGSAGFTYEFDPKLDLFVRTAQSLGPIFTDRAQTLGRGKFTASFGYTHAEFDTLDGENVHSLNRTVNAGEQLRATSDGSNLPGIADDVIRLSVNLGVKADNFNFAFSYGVTDRLDVGIAVPVWRIDLEVEALAQIKDRRGDSGSRDPNDSSVNRLVFNYNPEANDPGKDELSDFRRDSQTIYDSDHETSSGVGDVLLRGKYRLLESAYADVASVLNFTIPTGGASNFRGFHNPTGTPILVVSKSLEFVSPHFNAGFAIRSKQDIGQALWAAGADVRVFPWLTVVPDFLGFHDVYADSGVQKNDIYQYAFGVKVNPWRQLVLAANFQFPLNREGLRADVIYTGQIEYTF